uniref:LysR substrate-binding domain-containing protein n=1 Tax=Thaumasiovibrio occultus TaxID=1891184 RepID=UPI000B35FBF6|nr:LysR substrate-binding domain-containing protein [Thaumasiovibrio occultus]
MDIDALRSFMAFVETGSFTRAAKQICRTQSAFSAQMRKLEEEVGSALFEKQGRNLILSEAGIQLSSHAKQLVMLHDKALVQVQRYQGKAPLRLGCPEDYNQTILPRLIARLRQAAPTCSIHVFSEPSVVLRQKLDAGELDAAVLTRAPDSEEGHWLAADQGVWIASAKHNASAISPLPLALFQTDCKYHAAAIDGLTKRGIPFELVACCNTASAQLAIVKQDLAIGAMGRASIDDSVRVLDSMPPLPAVDIVLSVAAKSHPILTEELLTSIGGLLSDEV